MNWFNLKYAILLFAIVNGLLLAAQTRATTENGEFVVLYEDGTWEFETGEYYPIIVSLEAPTNEESLAESSVKVSAPSISLIKSETNKSIEAMEWFGANNLDYNSLEGADLQQWLENSYAPFYILGVNASKVIHSNGLDIIIYNNSYSDGQYLAIYNSELSIVSHIYDFTQYTFSSESTEEDASFVIQDITWAETDGEVLYVSNAHRTYAASSFGKNAYITAIDLNTDELLWRTKPLVANARNFVLNNEYIITGYGFTAEKDYLYILNKHTGKVLSQTLLKSGPDYFVLKGDKLFIRTYDTEYEYKFSE